MFYEFTRDEKHSILISSHIVSDLERLCDYVAFLHKGKLLLFEEKLGMAKKFRLLCECTDRAESVIKDSNDAASLLDILSEIRSIIEN